jgi:hypothetical protein
VPLECSLFHKLILEAEMRFARLAQFASVALALITATNVHAASTIYGTYYDDNAAVGCASAAVCRLNFAQIPADKLLMISKITCYVNTVAGPPVELDLRISATSGGGNLARYLNLPFPAPTAASII